MLSKEEMKALEEIERCIGYDAMISVKSISILYNLYMKEKEKNKELEEGLKYRINYCPMCGRKLNIKEK